MKRFLIVMAISLSLESQVAIAAGMAASSSGAQVTNQGQIILVTPTVGVPFTSVSSGSVFNPFPFAGASAPLVSNNTSVFNPFPLTGAAAPLSFTGDSIFNPFPLAGASAPLASSNTSIFNPFPLAGAAAPLAFPGSGVVTDVRSGSGSAPFFPNSAVASPSSVAAASIPTVVTSPSMSVIGSGNVLNPFPLTGAATPVVVNNTSIFTPFPFAALTTPLTTAALTLDNPTAVSTSGFTQAQAGVLIQNPEPTSLILLATGLIGLAWRARARGSRTAKL